MMGLAFGLITDADILDIELISRAAGGIPLAKKGWLNYLNRFGHVGLLAKSGDIAVGFVLFSVLRVTIGVHQLAVLPDSRRQGVGSEILRLLKNGFWPCAQIVISAPKADDAATAFLQSNGFMLTEDYEIGISGFESAPKYLAEGELLYRFVLEPWKIESIQRKVWLPPKDRGKRGGPCGS